MSLETFLEVYVPINLNYWKLYREEKINKEALRFSRLDDAFRVLNISVTSELIHILSDEYISFLSTFNHLFDGTLEILEYLKPKYKLHIITNGFKEVQHGKLKKSGIAPYFETVTNSEMVGVKKPNRKIFDHALALAKADIDASLMIGDNLEADILGAKNMGMDALCFNYHKAKIPEASSLLISYLNSNNSFKLKKYYLHAKILYDEKFVEHNNLHFLLFFKLPLRHKQI